MRLLFGIYHPKDVYFFKNIINRLINEDHEIKIVSQDKDVTLELLTRFGFNFEIIKRTCGRLTGKLRSLIRSNLHLIRVAKDFKPDIFIHGSSLAQVSKIFGKPHIDYCDTEHAILAHIATFPFSDIVCTPSCFKGKIYSKKHIMFDGYSELAYLHPNYFKPDKSVLDELGLTKGEDFVVVRFVSWKATHDIGQIGIINKKELIEKLNNYVRIVISSESKLPRDLEKYKISLPPHRIHDLLYYASMYIGEGATMASEAAILGTISLYINSLKLGYLEDIEKNYGLIYNFNDPLRARRIVISKAIEMLNENNLKKRARKKSKKLIKEKIDVTKFMTNLIKNFNN